MRDNGGGVYVIGLLEKFKMSGLGRDPRGMVPTCCGMKWLE